VATVATVGPVATVARVPPLVPQPLPTPRADQRRVRCVATGLQGPAGRPFAPAGPLSARHIP